MYDEPDYDESDYEEEPCSCPECYGGGMKEELAFVMFKPDAFERGLVGELMSIIDSKGLRLVVAKTVEITEQQLVKHYAHHVGKNFWSDMVEFYTSAPTLACVFKGERASDAVRQLIGSKHPSESPPGSIRGRYATSFPKNLIHGSDSYHDALNEMSIFLTKEEIDHAKNA